MLKVYALVLLALSVPVGIMLAVFVTHDVAWWICLLAGLGTEALACWGAFAVATNDGAI